MIIVLQNTQTAVNYWKQERLIIDLQTQGSSAVPMWTNLSGTQASPIASYYPSNGGVTVDMTDYARTYGSSLTHIYLADVDNAIVYDVELTFKGLINPADVYIPEHVLQDAGALVVPPSKIIRSSSANDSTRLELYAPTGTWVIEDASTAAFTDNKRAIINIKNDFCLQETVGDKEHLYTLSQMQCGTEYILVQWVSFSGVIRRSWFEVVKRKSSAEANYSLLPVDNEYVEIKGRVDGMTLCMRGLSAYDLWYYADVINSSNVQVSRGTEAFQRVQVVTKTITLPDGENTDGKLEIEINWRRYDAVAM